MLVNTETSAIFFHYLNFFTRIRRNIGSILGQHPVLLECTLLNYTQCKVVTLKHRPACKQPIPSLTTALKWVWEKKKTYTQKKKKSMKASDKFRVLSNILLCFHNSIFQFPKGVRFSLFLPRTDKKSLRVHWHNHKSSENSQIRSVAVQSVPKRFKLSPGSPTPSLKREICDCTGYNLYLLHVSLIMVNNLSVKNSPSSSAIN